MTKSEPFAKMYQSVIKDKRINETAFRVLAFIKSYSNNWRAYQSHIARDLGLSASTVYRSINLLEESGYLTFDEKITKTGTERRNIKMTHKPSHWNEPKTVARPRGKAKAVKSKVTATPFKNDELPQSELNSGPVNNDCLPKSHLTPNEEIADTSYVELGTERHYEELASSGMDEVSFRLWSDYNAPIDGYLPMAVEDPNSNDAGLVTSMYDHMRDVKIGLSMKPGEVDQYDTGLEYHRELVADHLQSRKSGLPIPPKYWVQLVGNDFFLYVRPPGYRN